MAGTQRTPRPCQVAFPPMRMRGNIYPLKYSAEYLVGNISRCCVLNGILPIYRFIIESERL